MHFLSKPILVLGLVGSLASASPVLPTPSLTTSVISGTSIAPLATSQAALNATQLVSHLDIHSAIKNLVHGKDYVGHSKSKAVLAKQHELAMNLVPVSYYCHDFRTCHKMGMKYLVPEVNEAVQNVTVSMEQIKASPLTIEVTITNNGTGPITFWKNLSPISSYALYLGYFHFQTETDGVVFGKRLLDDAHGYRPDSYSDLVEVDAGQSVSSRIKLPENSDDPKSKSWLKMLEMAGDVTVSMSGSWYGIWAGTKKEVMATDMDYIWDGFNFWNDLYIPWEATFPKESEKFVQGTGFAMRLDLD
ncbi:hypothetical protein FACUT_11695 [Fusarium acutatum]|uniref:Uncharacterized protein n=1 Tax=Fusarium acutatum TaxID=78861 RepID=A0A8H4JCL3_9HYPO|nr:hypothetical protein FACUT_11695 [Fusarium acutatum]